MKFLKNLTIGGKIAVLVFLAALIGGGKLAYDYFVPRDIKESSQLKATVDVPPLTYDKDANAPDRSLPEFNEPTSSEFVTTSEEIRGDIMGWNAQSGLMYSVGGKTTSVGSICEELGLNIKLNVQNSCTEQANALYAFAEDLAAGNHNPTRGAHFTGWMGDGVPNYLGGLNDRIKKAFGEEYIFQVMDFGGASFGEDKWMLKPKFKKDPRGSLTVTVVRDGDWNIAVLYAKQKGIKINNDLTTWDPDAINFISAPNDDYIEAAKFYVAGTKVTRTIVKDGKLLGDTTLAADGVSTWFPGDLRAASEKGGLVVVASTKDYAAQMPNALIFNKKWAAEHDSLMVKFCEAVGRGGDQVKTHDKALRFATEVAALVYADESMDATKWYDAFKSYSYTDDMGNEVEIGGSRVFNLADAANYVGIIGGADKYKSVYNTFGAIVVESYPEVVPSFPKYEEATNFTYLQKAYSKNKSTAGTVSKPSFDKGERITSTFSQRAYAIQFEVGSSKILPESYKVLNEIASQLIIAENLKVEVSGHTDNTGDDATNEPLSRARAKAVADYLATKDPDIDDRTSSYGYGSKRPVNPTADQNSKAERDKNRRVEIKLGH